MNINKDEMAKEKEHLKYVISIVEDTITKSNIEIDNFKADITKSKKFIWDNKSDYKDFEVCRMMNEEDARVDIINMDIIKVYRLYRSLESPFFSRIDFKTQDIQTFYIGLTGIHKDFEPIVYDWRANISNLYYNYGLGESEYHSEEGIVKGITLRKREFDIEFGKIISSYDSILGSRDAILEKALSDNSSEKMKNIVMTIQKEQNEIIRYKKSANVIVEGVAGSGKTSIALHRIAYLLYNDKNLTNKNILIFSPSENFSAYISGVLPELGEENVTTTTYQELVNSFLHNSKAESLLDFAKRKTKKREDIAYKMSFEYKQEIDDYLNDYFYNLKFHSKIGLKDKFLGASTLNELKSSVPKRLRFYDKIDYLCEKICREFRIDEIKNLDKMKKNILKILSIPKYPEELYEQFIKGSIQQVIPYEDTYGLLYLFFEVHGYPAYGYIRNIVIDEAQDYALWQLQILRNIFKSAVFTILGDSHQAINNYVKYQSLEEMKTVFKDAKFILMNKAYRSSASIVEFTNKIFHIKDIVAVRKDSRESVKIINIDNLEEIKKLIESFKSKGYKNIGIIVKTSEELNNIRELVKKSVHVEDVYNAKGLEYDAVIVYTDKDNAYTSEEKNLLYIAASRALHELIVINQNRKLIL